MPKAQAMLHSTLINLEKIVAAYTSNVGETIQVLEVFLARSGEIPYREGEN